MMAADVVEFSIFRWQEHWAMATSTGAWVTLEGACTRPNHFPAAVRGMHLIHIENARGGTDALMVCWPP